MKSLIVILSIFMFGFLHSSNELYVVIKDNDGKRVHKANVWIMKGNDTVIKPRQTDIRGRVYYSTLAADETYRIEVKADGFKHTTKDIVTKLHELQKETISLELE